MYVSYSNSAEYDVYWHHQNSSACIIFNECRDKVVREALKNELISLSDQTLKNHADCSMPETLYSSITKLNITGMRKAKFSELTILSISQKSNLIVLILLLKSWIP